MKQAEIKKLTTEELLKRIDEVQLGLKRMRINHKVSELENPLTIRATRRTVARLKTELTKRKP